jgi:hypothetical protein
MRIPPSTVVMALVTMVPFGLAIRALVAHLTTQLGAPTQDPDDTLHWARRPGLRLTREDGMLTLTAGQVE